VRHSKQKKRRGGQPGPRPLKMSEIPVVDSHGDRVKVLVREFRQPVPGSGIERKHVAYELNSGERVQLLDEDTFILARTGTRFVRVPE
jgi:hypothetical protein